MAKAIVNCTCKICGNNFNKTKNCSSRKEADSYTEWALYNITTCSDCIRSERERKNEEKYNSLKLKYSLPVIEGVSEKQMAYAELLRRNLFLDSEESKIQKAARLIETADRKKIAKIAQEKAITEDEALKNAMYGRGYGDYYIALTCSDAATIIQVFK